MSTSTGKKTARQGETAPSEGVASYHHGNLRQALVEEGLSLLEATASADFSLRELARRVGVSANATYRHFENKEALLAAMAAEGFRRFSAAQLQAVQGRASPLAGIRAGGRAYVEFARRHPALFRLMFGRFTAASRGEEVAEAGQQAFDGLRRAVAAMLDRTDDDPGVEVAALHAWSVVHGLSHLVLDGQLERYGQDVEALIDAVLGQAVTLGGGRTG